MENTFGLIIGAIFINNILLSKFLGNCPFLGVSKKMDTAIGMSAAVVFVLTLAGVITWVVERFVLGPFRIGYIQTLAFILVIATLVQFVELFLRKAVPALYKSLGIFLPLITTNCAVLGTALINIQEELNLLDTIIFSVASAAGFGLALVLFAGLRERFEISRIPKPLEGTGIGLVTAGLLALSFFAFKGMI
ncbi:MAG: electron transport complex subunit RsxA [Acidobacteriota bacterium]|nr:MAG: electron transport complex subunit RsxA [Acidobacteriota bacterium]